MCWCHILNTKRFNGRMRIRCCPLWSINGNDIHIGLIQFCLKLLFCVNRQVRKWTSKLCFRILYKHHYNNQMSCFAVFHLILLSMKFSAIIQSEWAHRHIRDGILRSSMVIQVRMFLNIRSQNKNVIYSILSGCRLKATSSTTVLDYQLMHS